MIHITPALLRAATGCKQDNADIFAPHYDKWCAEFGISNRRYRLTMFLANLGHESGSLAKMLESMDYTPEALIEVFGAARITKEFADWVGRVPGRPANQRLIANVVYGGKWGLTHLGNTYPEDGWKYRGHAHMQLTGRSICREATNALRKRDPSFPSLEEDPDAMLRPDICAAVSCWFWASRDCNELADVGDFRAVVKRINGGTNGMPDREKRLATAMAAIGEIDASAEPVDLAPADQPIEAPAMPTSLPAGDAPMPEPDPQPTTQPQEQPMAPILAGIGKTIILDRLPDLLRAIPRVGALFAGDSEVAKRNLELVKVVTDTIAPAVGATNAQGLVEALTDPAKVAAAREAVDANWGAIHAAHEASIDKAREFMVQHGSDRIVVWNMVFHEVLALVLVLMTGIGMVTAFIWGNLSNDTKNQIITLALIGGFLGVKEFFYGGSRGSDATKQLLNQVLKR